MLLLDVTSDLGIPKKCLGTPNKYFGVPNFFSLDFYPICVKTSKHPSPSVTPPRQQPQTRG
jgi:hypothetical protein